jgi:cytochrome c-type biogenesis protein CcsB
MFANFWFSNFFLWQNLSFVLLFLSMSFFWFDLAFGFPKSKGEMLEEYLEEFRFSSSKALAFRASQALNSKSQGLSSSASLEEQQPDMQSTNTRTGESSSIGVFLYPLAKYLILFANISLFVLLCLRWLESGHFPLSNLYESLMFLSWGCTSILVYYLFGSLFKNRENQKNPSVFLEKILGSVLTPCALFLNAFATFSLPTEMQKAGPLVPALQSNWLMMHVTVMIISYAALILGSLLSIAFLIYRATVDFTAIFLNNKQVMLRSSRTNTTPIYEGNRDCTQDNVKQDFLDKVSNNLDFLSYRIIGIGFPFLTIGILSGAVWANEAWGSYWSWDPKETWALLTWLVFAIYLHTRFTKGWEGKKPAIIASVGFIVVWICYLGVNLLGEGLHSYGFLNA